ncbi:glycosyltransferase family 4 protein [Lactobacillus delbrueckii]|uniref:glycosyltransferase family 4 protein n=1 Tax=Lactobacillus delbrueckii TaxID=1584 RepID=UPI001F142377|nr:glycosyltransferase family 4 protein [Lactobacillus delbrueckii]
MVYEYANRLVNDGCEVSILFMNGVVLSKFRLPERVRRIGANFMTQIEPKWFNLDKRIKKISMTERNYQRKIDGVDVCIATAVETADLVQNHLKANKKVYFIQDYENWHVSEKNLRKTYNFGMANIVISKWLKKTVDQYSKKPAILIQNPIDTSIYSAKVEINKRKAHSIALLYHLGKHKGLNNALEAIKRLKEIYPDLTVQMFGVPDRPEEFPDWINYHQRASQEETVKIYNSSQVFLCSTLNEGFGLTGFEAMSCGACLVSTNYTGVREYAIDEFNALLSPVGDIDAQVHNVVRVFEDADLREMLSQNGINTGSKYSWEEATQKFEQAIGYKKVDSGLTS